MRINMKTINLEYNNYLEEDYKYAVLNILWHRDDNVRTIIFANIELYPNEYPQPIDIPETYKRIGSKGRQYLYFCRIIDTAKNLINLYESMASNKSQLTTFWQEKKEVFESCHYSLEPLYPVMSLVQSPPYLPDYSGCIRTSFLFNQFFPTELKEICLDEKNLAWINQQLNFNINEHQEYFGAIILSAPNPLIRKIHYRGGGELTDRVHVNIEPRNNVDISKLELLFLEKRPKGFSSFVKQKLDNNIITIKAKQEVEQTGYAIVCPERGLIDWHEFCGFMKSLHLELNVASEEITVNVKGKDYETDEETYTVQRYSKTPGIKIEDEKPADILDFLYKIKIQKNKQKQLKTNDQKTFYNDTLKATKFVRSVIAKARERVIIIDPYLSTRELFKYALSVTTSVDIILVTSKMRLDLNEYNILKRHLEGLSPSHIIKIYVMKGRDPIFHDRFLIIDKEVWLSGNSLADIGNRVSTIVKLPNPDEITEIYDSIISDAEKICKFEELEMKNASSE